MGKTNYYYDPPHSDNIVEKPGAVCDLCCKLSMMGPRKDFVKIPATAADRNNGSDDVLYAHPSCVRERATNLQRELSELYQAMQDQAI